MSKPLITPPQKKRQREAIIEVFGYYLSKPQSMNPYTRGVIDTLTILFGKEIMK